MYWSSAVDASTGYLVGAYASIPTSSRGYALEWWERDQLRTVLASERYLGALFDPRSGHLQPMKYVLGLARAASSLGVRVFEQSQVVALERGARPALWLSRDASLMTKSRTSAAASMR